MIKLFESYKTQRELEKLTKAVLDKIARETYGMLYGEADRVEWLTYIKLGEVYNNFNELKSFIIDEADMDICILPNNDISGGAQFTDGEKGKYINDGSRKMILINRKNNTLNKINDELDTNDLFKGDNLAAIKNYINRDYKSTMVHELQHVYDDWRSGGKSFKQSDSYLKDIPKYKKLNAQDLEKLKEDELEFIGKHYKEYLNLKHEVDAQFTQSILGIEFYNLDLDLSIENNKNVYLIKKFKDAKRDFEIKFTNFRFLTEKERWRVLRKFGQFYELEKDFVKELNSKQKEYKSK